MGDPDIHITVHFKVIKYPISKHLLYLMRYFAVCVVWEISVLLVMAWIVPQRNFTVHSLTDRHYWEMSNSSGRYLRSGLAELANGWNREYANGDWTYLKTSPSERARSALIIDVLYRTYGNGGTILDVGCGEGVLADYLHPDEHVLYTGIDISSTAIESAKNKSKSLTFKVTPAEDYHLEGTTRFSTIIFNEVLYYLNHIHIAWKYAQNYLDPQGILITSVWRAEDDTKKNRISTDLSKLMRKIDEIEVKAQGPMDPTSGRRKLAWNIEVYVHWQNKEWKDFVYN